MSRIFSIITAMTVFLGYACAQTVSNEPVVKECNLVMRGIYVDMLSIKDKYGALKNFGEENYDRPGESVSLINTHEYIHNIDGIRYFDSSIGVDIHFSRESCDKGCRDIPALELKNSKFGNYLTVYLSGASRDVTDEILRIVKKNAADIR